MQLFLQELGSHPGGKPGSVCLLCWPCSGPQINLPTLCTKPHLHSRTDKKWHSKKQMSLQLSISLPRFLQVAHSCTVCPAEGLCCTHKHSHAPAQHKPTPPGRELHRQHRVTTPNFSLQVKELCKLFLGFIYLLLIGLRMLLLPFTPSIHMGKAVLSAYTKRHIHVGTFFLRRKNVGTTLRKVPLN